MTEPYSVHFLRRTARKSADAFERHYQERYGPGDYFEVRKTYGKLYRWGVFRR